MSVTKIQIMAKMSLGKITYVGSEKAEKVEKAS